MEIKGKLPDGSVVAKFSEVEWALVSKAVKDLSEADVESLDEYERALPELHALCSIVEKENGTPERG